MSGFELLDIERDLSHHLRIEEHAWALLEEVTRLRQEKYRAIEAQIHTVRGDEQCAHS